MEKEIKWITLDEAEKIVSGFYTRKTLYAWIHQKKLTRKGPYHCAFIRKDQLLKVGRLEGLIDA